MRRIVILIHGKAVVMLLLGGGCSCGGRLGLSLLLLAMTQGLVIQLGTIVLPAGLFVLAVLLLVRVKMLRLEHGGRPWFRSGHSHPRFKKGEGEVMSGGSGTQGEERLEG